MLELAPVTALPNIELTIAGRYSPVGQIKVKNNAGISVTNLNHDDDKGGTGFEAKDQLGLPVAGHIGHQRRACRS